MKTTAQTASWKLSMATVTTSLPEWETPSYDLGENGYASFPKYTTGFAYSVEGKIYQGEYSTGTPQAEGMQFQILYDPADPERNTRSDQRMHPLLRVGSWLLGIALAWFVAHYFRSEY